MSPLPIGAQSLFAGMSQLGATPENDEAMMEIVRDGGVHEDGQVEDSQPGEQP